MTEQSENREEPYTVAQLIAELQKLPPDMRAMVRGYEGGYHDAGNPAVKKIALNVHDAWYYGPHEDGDGYEVRDKPDAFKIVDAVII